MERYTFHSIGIISLNVPQLFSILDGDILASRKKGGRS